MKYARHGHSVCTIGGRYILVSGSRKEVNQAAQRVELYDIQIDEWVELCKINEGRHYHSSCNLNNNFVYIFGGIQNSNKKYSASIERMAFSLDNFNNPWEKINMSYLAIQNPSQSLTARQGAGMCQLSPDELMIVGGFNGKFLTDYYIVQIDQSSGQPKGISKFERLGLNNQTLFPFQVPTIGDLATRQAISIDWQQMALYHFNGNQWSYQQHVKQ